jgi:hypothetical protein
MTQVTQEMIEAGREAWSNSARAGAAELEDRLVEAYRAMKALDPEVEGMGKEHASAFMQGWSRAKLHDDTLEKAFERWRVCAEPDVLPVDVVLRKLAQIRKLALSCEGHSYDLIIALADEALSAALSQEQSK